jgi:hypothetical protein
MEYDFKVVPLVEISVRLDRLKSDCMSFTI